jgi:hypothetical protein
VVEPPDHLEILTAGQNLVDRGELACEADLAADTERIGGDVAAEHNRTTRLRHEQRRERAHERRLAGAVRAQQREHVAPGRDQIEAVERDDLAARKMRTAEVTNAPLALRVRFGAQTVAAPPYRSRS